GASRRARRRSSGWRASSERGRGGPPTPGARRSSSPSSASSRPSRTGAGSSYAANRRLGPSGASTAPATTCSSSSGRAGLPGFGRKQGQKGRQEQARSAYGRLHSMLSAAGEGRCVAGSPPTRECARRSASQLSLRTQAPRLRAAAPPPGAARRAPGTSPTRAGCASRCRPVELLEHPPGRGRSLARSCPPLGCELGAQRAVAIGRLEGPPDHELRRRGAVPGVLREPEGDVVLSHPPVAVEMRAETEGDRAAGGTAAVEHAEAQVLALPYRLQVAQLAACDEQRHAWVAEAEGCEPLELGGELERERPAWDDRVDGERRIEIAAVEQGVGVRRERLRERLDALGPDGEAGRGAVPAEALEMGGAGAERSVQVEGCDRAPGPLPVVGVSALGRPGDQHDRPA